MSTTAPVHPERNRRKPPDRPEHSRREPPVRPEPVEGHPLCKHLPLIAAAPSGIKKLRELILELAVRGKLVPQDPEDEPAGELLERIQAERLRMEEADVLKKTTPLQINEDDKPYDTPVGWTWVCLGGLLSKIGAGSTPLGGKRAYVSEGVKFLRSQNIWDEGLRLSGVALIPPVIHQKMSGTHVQAGDLLFNITGASIGRCALVPDDFDVANVSQHVSIIRPIDADTRFFLHKLLISRYVQKAVMDVQVGVSREGLSIRKLSQFVIPLPPLAEQHRIVTKVDELMALCDRLEAQQADTEAAHATLVKTLLDTLTQSQSAADFATNWQRLSAHFDTLFTTESSIDALKQTLLQLAVMGKLVPQDPADEPASQLIERVERERARLIRAGKIKPSKALRETGGATQLFQLPVGWRWAAVMQVCDVQGGIQKTPKRRPISNHYPYLRVANVQRAAITVTDLERFEMLSDELTRWRLKSGDILVVEGNGSEDEIGRCAIWDGEIPDCVYQNHLIRVRPALIELANFIQLFLNSPPGMDEMKRLAVTTSGLFNLSVGKIKSIQIPIPPVAEQERIVAEVDALLRQCNQLKARLTTSHAAHERLAAALIEQAVAA